ncbi:MAG: hypothetical protein LBH16_02000 [Treponema sp.]|jgi:WD40 repeat protein|nr:hypothetical protein [Treponema sp.]
MSKEQLAMNNEEKRRIKMKMQWKFVCLAAVLSVVMLVTALFAAACGTSPGAKDDAKTGPSVSLHVGYTEKSGDDLLIFSPDKKYIATVSVEKGIVKIWDAKNVTVITTINVGQKFWNFVLSELIWSGRRISVRYNYQSGNRPMAFVDTYDAVTGKLISSKKTDDYEYKINRADRIARLGNRSDLDRITTLMHKAPENLVAINWSQDGSRIVTANQIRAGTSSCYVWNTATASFDSNSIVDIHFTGSETPTTTQFNTTTAHDIKSVAQKNDGTIAVGMWPHGWLQTYNEGARILSTKTLQNEGHRIRKLVYSPDGTQILILGGNPLFNLWEVETTRVKYEFIEIFDSDTGGRIRNLVSGSEQNSTDIYYDIAWSPDGTQAAAVSDKSIKVWNALSGALIMSINNPETANGRENRLMVGGKKEKAKYIVITSLAFSPDGKRLVYGDEFGAVSILDIQAKKVIQTFSSGKGEIAAVAFSPDSKQVLAVGGGNLKVWDAENGSEIKTLQLTFNSNLTYESNRVVFSPDANRVAYINSDSIIKVLHIPSGKSASLAVYADDEWAACADEGISFNSNGKGERLISITSNGKMLPRESYESMNNPAPLRQILTGKE